MRRYLSMIALSVMALVATGVDSVLVLCVGQDEHREIEIAVAGRCVGCLGEDEHGLSPEAVTVTGSDHCGTCVDTELRLQRVSIRSPKELQPPVLWPLSAVMTVATRWRPEPGFFHYSRLPDQYGPVTHLKSVRLII